MLNTYPIIEIAKIFENVAVLILEYSMQYTFGDFFSSYGPFGKNTLSRHYLTECSMQLSFMLLLIGNYDHM